MMIRIGPASAGLFFAPSSTHHERELTMWKLIVAGLVLALAGCETTVVLRNPETGAMTQCTTDGNRYLLARREVEQCAAAYERADWGRMT
jgi:hypothetical protein